MATAEETKEIVRHIIDRGLDNIHENLDRLHRRDIHDNDVVEALRSLGENDILDSYAEWADIDLREDDNTTTNPVVPDPADAPSYAGHPLNKPHTHAGDVQTALEAIKAQLVKEREKELYFDPDYDGESAMIDGPVNLLDLAEAVVKGLGK